MGVFVDDPAAQAPALDEPAGVKVDDLGTTGRLLVKAAMRSVPVVVVEVAVEQDQELAAVPYQGAVEEFAAGGADPALQLMDSASLRWRNSPAKGLSESLCFWRDGCH